MHNTSLLPSLGYTIYQVHYRGYTGKKNSCTCNHAMEIQTLKPEKCSLTLDASRIIQRTQQTDFPPEATTTFSQQLALSADEAWERPSASAPGDLTNFQIPAEPPLMTPPLSTKQLDRLAPIMPTKVWNVRPLAFLGWAEGPEASTETRPPDL
jgi:hypothetical protein